MKIAINFSTSTVTVLNNKKKLEAYIRKVVEKAHKQIDFDNIKILIKSIKSKKIISKLGGISGYCPSKNYIEIGVDNKRFFTKNNLFKAIEKTLLHEIHHISRRNYGINFEKEKFLEIIVSEGIADYFVYKNTKELSLWIKKYEIKKYNDNLKKMIISSLNKDFSISKYNKWFLYGSKQYNIPKWTGYYFGFQIIKKMIDKRKINFRVLTKTKAKIINDKYNLENFYP